MCPVGMRIVFRIIINDRIVSIRNNTNVFLQRKPGRNKRPGFFMPDFKKKERYIMKFVLIVLVIRFLAEAITKKDKTVLEEEEAVMNVKIYHPSEFQLR